MIIALFDRTWTLELKSRKIRVNALSPGPIDTAGLNNFVSGLGMNEEVIKKTIVSAIPLGRMGTPDEVAKAVLFLASDDSSFITGIELFVDGGSTQI
jgi:NAD(P)-dependent dehydrogenase (short-subunit alcohol dehydrogenase family)